MMFIVWLVKPPLRIYVVFCEPLPSGVDLVSFFFVSYLLANEYRWRVGGGAGGGSCSCFVLFCFLSRVVANGCRCGQNSRSNYHSSGPERENLGFRHSSVTGAPPSLPCCGFPLMHAGFPFRPRYLCVVRAFALPFALSCLAFVLGPSSFHLFDHLQPGPPHQPSILVFFFLFLFTTSLTATGKNSRGILVEKRETLEIEILLSDFFYFYTTFFYC